MQLSPTFANADFTDLLDAFHLKRELAGLPSLKTLFRYCPQIPHPRQLDFLNLTCLEALLGGSGGGGKSSALMMAALMYVDRPRYSALILRRTKQSLRLAGGLIPRAEEWLGGTDAHWHGQDSKWTFPSGATLEFGYVDNFKDVLRYRSTEYQFYGFEEFSEFEMHLDVPEMNPYLYLRRSARRNIDDQDIPIRFRAASNPGNVGHNYMLKHFMTEEAKQVYGRSSREIFWKSPDVCYLPSYARDNKSIDTDAYHKVLDGQPAIMRAQMKDGNFNVRLDTEISASSFRYYRIVGDDVILFKRDRETTYQQFPLSQCTTFVTCDAAGTSADKAKAKKGNRSSYSAIGVWIQPPASVGNFLILLHVTRARFSIPELKDELIKINRHWQPSRILVENEKFGQAVVQLLDNELPIRTITTGGKDKKTRAIPLIDGFANGKVYLPDSEPDWLSVYVDEVTTWTGMDTDISDQVDMSAYAAQEVFIATPPLWDARFFGADSRYSELPDAIDLLGIGVMPAMPGGPSAIVCAARSRGLLYVDGFVDRVGAETCLTNIPGVAAECFPGIQPHTVMVDREFKRLAAAKETAMRDKGLRSRVVTRTLPDVEIAADSLDSGIREGMLRYSTSPGGNAIVSRLSSYPDSVDHVATLGMQLAVEALNYRSRA